MPDMPILLDKTKQVAIIVDAIDSNNLEVKEVLPLFIVDTLLVQIGKAIANLKVNFMVKPIEINPNSMVVERAMEHY